MTLRHIIEGCVVEAPDAEHARKLFDELTDALAQLATQKVTKVLLTCTSAMTTTFFARKLQEVAATLSLDFEFEATNITRALEVAGDYMLRRTLTPWESPCPVGSITGI